MPMMMMLEMMSLVSTRKASGRYTRYNVSESDAKDAEIKDLREANRFLEEENARKLAEMEAKFLAMLKAATSNSAAQAGQPTSGSDDEDGDKKMPAKEASVHMEEDNRGTDANSGSHKPGATGGAKAGGTSPRLAKPVVPRPALSEPSRP